MASLPIMAGRFIAITLPAGSILLANTSMADSGNDTIDPSELPIYDVEEASVKYPKRTKSTLETYVSTTRKSVYDITRQLIDITHGVRNSVTSAKERITSTTQDIINKEGLLPRVGLIGFAGLTGFVIAGRRKGIFRRFFYPVGFLTVSSMLCYPVETVNISRSTWRYAKHWYSGDPIDEVQEKNGDSLLSIANSIKTTVNKGLTTLSSSLNSNDNKTASNSENEELEDTAPAVKDSTDNIVNETSETTESLELSKDNLHQDNEENLEVSQTIDDSNKESELEPEPPVDKKETEPKVTGDYGQSSPEDDKKEMKPKIIGDYGQSSPEDSDMYTTR
ncbi:MICOS complex subunit MIC27 [Trichoplax sp. H2]|uniref:MICOS complex subunit n=1 Tax=Trichoplax adhaerens TaxID=10228 RepID=B3S140_TRIAD|nr:hypothetical protein TRIADDRAFT_58187 [Trichoplax adhaerens]EDV23171.1 hypothetical protein TRIADDRAFT_58187 [Trichoplax adhaerens]RDD47904.1 MICOS complex subunit MIC27 [Trichoplax sp. H2]|eukprot:XP_002114081.1 hypothetical protein TRIADDRAFT_58187 [Trichoplax adhaerens]